MEKKAFVLDKEQFLDGFEVILASSADSGKKLTAIIKPCEGALIYIVSMNINGLFERSIYDQFDEAIDRFNTIDN